MKSLSSQFNEDCAKKYQSLGFRRSKKTFIRIRGETIQTFSLQYSRIGRAYSVHFGLYPLCLPQPVYFDEGEYELYRALDPCDNFTAWEHSGWEVKSKSDTDMLECIESIIKAIDLYLIPFFDRCIDCKTSLTDLLALEKTFDYNRRKYLQLKGITDCAKPWQYRSMLDSKKLYMALKTSNWSYARQYFTNWIDCYKGGSKQFDKSRSTEHTRLTELLECLQKLEGKDYGYFHTIVKCNEIEMRKFLTTQYPKLLFDYYNNQTTIL